MTTWLFNGIKNHQVYSLNLSGPYTAAKLEMYLFLGYCVEGVAVTRDWCLDHCRKAIQRGRVEARYHMQVTTAANQ